MKNKTSTIKNFKFWPHVKYYLNRIGIIFNEAYVFKINLDDMKLKAPETKNIIIKECKIEDLDQFGKLKDEFQSYIMDDHILIAAFLNNLWVGYMWISFKHAKVTEVERIFHFKGAYLWNSYVREECRCRGIAKKMLNFSLNLIKNKYNQKEAYGIVLTSNIPSIKTIEYSKFSRTGFLKYWRIFFLEKFSMHLDGDGLCFKKY